MRYDDCEEIQSGGLLKRCVERPDSMHNITSADWESKKYDIDHLPIKNEEECNDDKMLDHTIPM